MWDRYEPSGRCVAQCCDAATLNTSRSLCLALYKSTELAKFELSDPRLFCENVCKNACILFIFLALNHTVSTTK